MAEAITNVASVLESDMTSEQRTDLATNLLGTMGTILTPSSENTDASSNVRGISNFNKRRTIYTWRRKQKADIIFLQETHSKKETEVQWKNEWGAEMLFSHGSPNSCGTAILITNNTNCKLLSTIPDPLGRFIILKIPIEEKVYVLANIYAPNKDKDLIQFF